MTHTPLAGERLQPLGHVSAGGTSENAMTEQALFTLNMDLFLPEAHLAYPQATQIITCYYYQIRKLPLEPHIKTLIQGPT